MTRNPAKREMLISTRFGDVPQIHRVAMPGGARTQLTFFSDRTGGALYRPGAGDSFVFSKDIGGGEFYQLYRFDAPSSAITLLTDGYLLDAERLPVLRREPHGFHLAIAEDVPR